MDLFEQISNDIKEAMKAKDKVKNKEKIQLLCMKDRAVQTWQKLKWHR